MIDIDTDIDILRVTVGRYAAVNNLDVMQRNVATPRNVRRILVRGSMPPCRLRRRKLGKFDYEMVHSEVYLNKYAVIIVQFYTPACHDCSQNITYT